MFLKMISCEVLARMAYYAAAFSPHVIDIELVDKGLHDEPDTLRADLQRRIDAVDPEQYDAILLGYGLCSNSIAGLVSSELRMVIPRAHDCITLYLGSGERYSREFREHPGTYWYTADYIERGGGNSHVALGVNESAEEMDATYKEYVEKYGQDNADYLMEVMGAWKQHYDRAAYIEAEEVDLPDYTAHVEELAERRGWKVERMAGSIILIRDLLEGRWDDERFLIVPPGKTILPTHDGCVIREGAAEEL
jgi:hypothetical protein